MKFLICLVKFRAYVVNFRLLKIFKEKFQSFSLKIKFFYTKGPFCTTFVAMKFLICLVKFRVCVVKKSKNLIFSKIFQNFENGYSAFKYPWGVVQYGMGFVFVHSTLNYLGNFRSVTHEWLQSSKIWPSQIKLGHSTTGRPLLKATSHQVWARSETLRIL